MNTELVFIVDAENNPLQPQPRYIMIRDNLYCRTSSVTVINPERTLVLCQKRSDSKDQRPGLWITEFGGKSDPGEESIITAQRELAEEIGITASKEELHFYGLEKSEERKQFGYYYYIERSTNTATKADPTEVSETAWIDINEVVQKLKSDKTWYSYGLDIELLESLTKN